MARCSLRLCVFGREMLIVREAGEWVGYHIGADGKRRRATDLVIPAHLEEDEVVTYLADLFHEAASTKHPKVTVLDK